MRPHHHPNFIHSGARTNVEEASKMAPLLFSTARALGVRCSSQCVIPVTVAPRCWCPLLVQQRTTHLPHISSGYVFPTVQLCSFCFIFALALRPHILTPITNSDTVPIPFYPNTPSPNCESWRQHSYQLAVSKPPRHFSAPCSRCQLLVQHRMAHVGLVIPIRPLILTPKARCSSHCVIFILIYPSYKWCWACYHPVAVVPLSRHFIIFALLIFH